MRGHELHSRSFTKAVTWRAVATLVSLAVIYVFTGEFIQSLKITVIAGTVSTLAYYLHERAWNAIKWGKR